MTCLFKYDNEGCFALLYIKIRPASKTNKIQRFILINEKHYLKMYIIAIAQEGEANKEIISFLSKTWRISSRNIGIIAKHKSQLKLLKIKNIEFEYLNSILIYYIQ
ncbi:MAG: DUF167 family protein [Janthinobacterium lividum]